MAKQENKRRTRFAEEQTQTEVKAENGTQTGWLEEVYEASEKGKQLENKAAEDIAAQFEADQEEDDLEREMIGANQEFLEMIDEVGEDDGAPEEGDAEAMLY
ncbi:unnamed protein product [Heligmosomoides polygyrus]|uniref:General stress protein n=1 Tax=Heligmosomoides polygyrus TaxID=6339 RepID=A0A183FTA4_HELPZ|nr:unnamed protein product [Heligmosomoides polygyrus]